MSQLFDCRDAFAAALLELAEQQPNIVAVVNDSVGSSKIGAFQKKFPDRLVNVGIAEQDLIGISAGLANGGLLPFVCGAACFMTARGLEQIKTDLAYSNMNVKLCGMSSGMAYGELGPTHHSIEDMAWTRVIANMTVVVPADPIETKQAMYAAAAYRGPMFLRISRMGVPVVHDKEYHFEIGHAALLHEGDDVTLIANGTMVSRALAAAQMLETEGVHARVLNMATVRPLDHAAVIRAARETRGIVTVEEHTVYGGLGGAVAEVVVQNAPVPMRILGVPGGFAPTGSAEFLFDYFGLTPDRICESALELLSVAA